MDTHLHRSLYYPYYIPYTSKLENRTRHILMRAFPLCRGTFNGAKITLNGKN